MPGEKDPTQAISTCPYCNSSVNQKAQVCQNCGKTITPQWGRPHPRKVPQKGERYQEYGPKHDFINPAAPVVASTKEARTRDKKKKDHAEHDKTTVKDIYVSDEFNMCANPIMKKKKNVDERKEEIMKSCLDLAIDG